MLGVRARRPMLPLLGGPIADYGRFERPHTGVCAAENGREVGRRHELARVGGVVKDRRLLVARYVGG